MRLSPPRVIPLLILLPVLWVAPAARGAGATRVELTDVETERTIASRALPEGDSVVLTWRNSLFGLDVTEVFVAASGRLELTAIAFADPAGGEPPRVRPQDVDDLYHTGGPFRAEGLSKPIRRVVFRVGEIGNPVLRMGGTRIDFLREVGFGGAVRLTARPSDEGRAGR